MSSSSLNLYSGGIVFSSSPTSTPFSFLCLSSYKGKKDEQQDCYIVVLFKNFTISCTTGPGVSPCVPYRDDVLGSELRGFRFWCVGWQRVAESAERIQRHGGALRAGSTWQLRQFKTAVKLFFFLNVRNRKSGKKGDGCYLLSFNDIHFDRRRHRTDGFLQKDADSVCLNLYLLIMVQHTDTRTDRHTQS